MAMENSGKTRGVEQPISTDMCLIGNTEAELASKSLPRRDGPNFGYGKVTSGSEKRDQG